MEVYLKLNVGGTYVDYTDYVDISSLKRNISLNAQNDPQRSQTGDIEVYGSAYSFVKTKTIYTSPDVHIKHLAKPVSYIIPNSLSCFLLMVGLSFTVLIISSIISASEITPR